MMERGTHHRRAGAAMGDLSCRQVDRIHVGRREKPYRLDQLSGHEQEALLLVDVLGKLIKMLP